MATDVESLVARLSLDIRQFRSEFNKSIGISNKAAKDVESAWSRTNAKLNGFGKSMASGLIAPLTGIAAAASVREVAAYADAWTTAGNKLAAAGQVAGRQSRTLEGINQIANDTRTGITETADLYAKLLRSTKDVAKSEEEVARATAITNKAFKAGGAAAGEQAAGILQLSQALGSGVLQGDELRSLRENAPLLAQAIADEFNTTIGGLKQLGADGELVSSRVFKAILNAQPKIEAAFAVTNQTIGEGVTKINNAFTQYIGQSDASLGATQRLVSGLNALADNFDTTADSTLRLASIIAAALIGRAIGGMIGKLGLATAATLRFVGALRGAAAIDGLALSMQGVGLAAGPAGAIVAGVLTAAVIAYNTATGEATDGSEQYAAALNEIDEAATKAATAVDELAKKRELATAAVGYSKREIEDIQAAIAGLFADLQNAPDSILDGGEKSGLKELERQLNSGEKSAEQVKEELKKLTEANPQIASITDNFDGFLDVLQKALKAATALRGELASLDAGNIFEGGRAQGFAQQSARELAQKDTAKFLSDREAESKRTEQQKKIDVRTDAIIAAADKAGVALTEAAAKIQAAGEIAAEDLAASTSKSVSSAAALIKEKEWFQPTGKWDVNAYRAGYGSSEVTLSDGSIVKVTQGMTVTLEQANRDLERRIGEFQAGIRKAIGADAFNAMTEQQQAVLTSIAYNYGSLPDRIIKAIATGDAGAVYTAIKGLSNDGPYRKNGVPVNKQRRLEEADIWAQGGGSGIAGAVKAGDSQEDFAKKLEEQRQYIAALQAETGIRSQLNPLVNDYGMAMTAVEVAQQLLTEAQKEGIEAGLELSDVQQLLYGDLSGLSPVAREQAMAMRELALSTGTAKAESEMLAESQKNLADSMRAASEFGKDVLGGLIRDLREGKSATEALANALNKVADKLLDMALNSLLDGIGGGGGGLLGGLVNILLNAKGGIVQSGKRLPMMAKGGITKSIAVAGEAGPEAIVPLPDGKRIPVVLSQPAGPVGRAGSSHDTVTLTLQDDSGRMADIANQQIKTSAGTIVNVAVQQSRRAVKADMPNLINGAQTRQM